ncbi:MAG: hypothetical protein ACYSSP_11230 [Planctomycetota bacterium]|jgi:hypothetical protein
MPDSDFNLIKPVDALGNITGISPVKRRENRERKKNQHQPNKGLKPELPEESDELDIDQTDNETQNDNEQNNSGIDYCA